MTILAFISAAALATGQITPERKADVARITGHMVEPGKLEPNEERRAIIKLPDGFRIERFAEVYNPRIIAVAPDGAVYVSQREPGTLTMIRDTNGDGVADLQRVVMRRKDLHGVAVHRNHVYFVTIKEIFRAPRRPDGTLGAPELLRNDLPDAGQHPNRTLRFGPDGRMVVQIGSQTNDAFERDRRTATLMVGSADAKDLRVMASGLRNTIGFDWHPRTGRLFGMDHGIDWLGDDNQPEELNLIEDGKRYGWPFIYADGRIHLHPEPPPGYTKEDWRAMSTNPVLMYTAHSAPMQMSFVRGDMFPAEYRGDAFVTMRGSWNRQPPSGYEVVRIRFGEDGMPTAFESFATGWLIPGGALNGGPGHIGRLCGLAFMPDGSMLIGDDNNGIIYRITHGGARQVRKHPQVLAPEVDGIRGAAKTLQVRTTAFADGGPIPLPHTEYGQGRSPALAWSGAPGGTRSFVLLMEDPDARSPKPFVHWAIANLSANARSIPAGIRSGMDRIPNLPGALQGANHMGEIGYFGPEPPAADPAHKYHFMVFALDRVLDLRPGYNRQALLDEMRGHVLAWGETVGTFDRDAVVKEDVPK